MDASSATVRYSVHGRRSRMPCKAGEAKPAGAVHVSTDTCYPLLQRFPLVVRLYFRHIHVSRSVGQRGFKGDQRLTSTPLDMHACTAAYAHICDPFRSYSIAGWSQSTAAILFFPSRTLQLNPHCNEVKISSLGPVSSIDFSFRVFFNII